MIQQMRAVCNTERQETEFGTRLFSIVLNLCMTWRCQIVSPDTRPVPNNSTD